MVIFEDHGEPPLSSDTTIQIKVIDIDDKDPVFDRNFYIGSIARNSKPGTMVNMTEPIFAFDQDFGINMTLEYSLNNSKLKNYQKLNIYFQILWIIKSDFIIKTT